MKKLASRISKKAILIILVTGFALTLLSGCGIGPGPYQHSYGAGKYDTGVYGYRSNLPAAPNDNFVRQGHGGAMAGYRQARGGYCGW